MAYDVPGPEILDIINEFWPVEVIFGEHEGDPGAPMWGYYAHLGEFHGHESWQEYGHGETILEAFEQARAIYLGLDYEAYPWDHFLSDVFEDKPHDGDMPLA